MTTPRTFAATALACVAAVCLSACGTLGGSFGNPLGVATNGNTQQILDNLAKINAAAAQHCTGAAHIAWNPPFPPTGSMNLDCYIQPPGSVIMGQGPNATIAVPLSQLSQFLGQAPAPAAAPGTLAIPTGPSQSVPVIGSPK